MQKINKQIKIIFLLLFIMVQTSLFGQTTGAIRGIVSDGADGSILAGVNIILPELEIGTASDMNGEFVILNIPPGKYRVEFSMIGYSKKIYTGLKVSVNRSSTINAELSTEAIQGESVIVEAKKISAKKDQTNSIRNVSGEDIQNLPVEDIQGVVEMQAGVVNGHFRGGRNTEVSYMIDGMQINDGFNKTGAILDLEKEAVQDVEVIIGTFNAEYGRAMSGIVNMVSKDGSDEFHGSMIGYLSNYITSNENIFIGLDKGEVTRNQDYKIQLEGPIFSDKLTFITNYRYQNNLGYLNGVRRFDVDNYSSFTSAEFMNDYGDVESDWDYYEDDNRYYSEHTGDGDYVALQDNEKQSLMTKISYKFNPKLKFSIMYLKNIGISQNYAHSFKYNPDGLPSNHDESEMVLFQFNHFVRSNLFYDLKVSQSKNTNGYYLYENPESDKYIHNQYLRGASSAGDFYTGGQLKDYQKYTMSGLNVKYNLNWQMNNSHNVKTGFVYTQHSIDREQFTIRNYYSLINDGNVNNISYNPETDRVKMYDYIPTVPSDSSMSTDIYEKEPYEFSGYLQDKMEFESMVINMGLRYDYFNANSVYPTQERNPGNQGTFDDEERMSKYPDTDAQSQISPRFGLAYTLADNAVFHMAYGHFFQMPPLYALYENANFSIPTGNFQTIHGETRLRAEKTVQYEMGLWQELIPGLGFEVNVFYRDIYNLLGTRIIETYNHIKYGKYTNKDYGNSKGLELKLDYVNGPLTVFVNYTLQYTRGNADNPNSAFTRAGENKDAVTILYPMPWDQRHTFNASAGYNTKKFGVTMTGYYNSGLPYTWTPPQSSVLARQQKEPNKQSIPANISVDLKGYYDFQLSDAYKMRLYLSVYNLLDNLNALSVDPTTGQPYSALILPSDRATFRSNFNDIYDKGKNPSMYSAPREVKVGLSFIF